MSVLDQLPERDTLPQFCPECGGVLSLEWDNGVTDPQKDRVEGYECVDCQYEFRITLHGVEP
jgi:hypothetical protein